MVRKKRDDEKPIPGVLTDEERKRLEEKISKVRLPEVEGTALTQGFMATSFTSVGGGPHTMEHARRGHSVGYLTGEVLPGKLELKPERLSKRPRRAKKTGKKQAGAEPQTDSE